MFNYPTLAECYKTRRLRRDQSDGLESIGAKGGLPIAPSQSEGNVSQSDVSRWLRTNEIEEFIGSLEHCADLAKGLGKNAVQWKWLILTLHNAVQGACTCALRGADTAGIAMLTTKSAAQVWHWLDVTSRTNPRAPKPREALAPMIELYVRVQGSNLPEEHRLPKNTDRDQDVKRLNALRNKFAHFVPHALALEVSGMPRIVRNSVAAIEHLAVHQPTFAHHLNKNRTRRIRVSLYRIKRAIILWEKTNL